MEEEKDYEKEDDKQKIIYLKEQNVLSTTFEE